MFLLLYSLALTVALAVASPWWLLRLFTTNRYREGLTARLGLIPPTLRAAITQARRHNRPTLWLHAVSVGEVLASVRLIEELRSALPTHLILISTTTATGQALARQRFPPAHVFYLPLDFALPVRRYLNLIRPALLLLMESELWPRLLAESARRRIPIAVLNARISDRSFPRYMALRALWRPILAHVTLFLAQGEETAARLRQLGVPPTKIQTPGNLKYDLTPAKSTPLTDLIRAAAGSREIIVAGSTLPGKPHWEEEMVLLGMERVWHEMDNALLILAPRHPQRFAVVRELIQDHGCHVVSATELLNGASLPTGPKPTILLDTMGDLASIYSLANVAFLGGSLVSKGGHNPLEAARFGIPIIMGPSYENFREIVEAMQDANAIRIVGPNEDLGEPILDLLSNDQGIGHNAQLFFRSQTGATTRTLQALLPLISTRDTSALLKGTASAVPQALHSEDRL